MRPYHFDFDRYRSRGPYRRHDACSPCRMLAEALRGLPPLWRKCRRSVRERAELAALDPRSQRDIGATPSEIAREISKPFWRV